MKTTFRIVLISLSVLLFTNCASKKLTKQAQKVDLLSKYYSLDQSARDSSLLLSDKVEQKLKARAFSGAINYIKEYGYPEPEDFGPYAELESVQSGIFTIFLHSPQKIVTNSGNLKLLLREVDKGNLKPKAIAILIDKYLWDQKQADPESETMGVLVTNVFGKPCLKYRKKSDSVRASIGLAPLKLYQFKRCDSTLKTPSKIIQGLQ